MHVFSSVQLPRTSNQLPFPCEWKASPKSWCCHHNAGMVHFHCSLPATHVQVGKKVSYLNTLWYWLQDDKMWKCSMDRNASVRCSKPRLKSAELARNWLKCPKITGSSVHVRYTLLILEVPVSQRQRPTPWSSVTTKRCATCKEQNRTILKGVCVHVCVDLSREQDARNGLIGCQEKRRKTFYEQWVRGCFWH